MGSMQAVALDCPYARQQRSCLRCNIRLNPFLHSKLSVDEDRKQHFLRHSEHASYRTPEQLSVRSFPSILLISNLGNPCHHGMEDRQLNVTCSRSVLASCTGEALNRTGETHGKTVLSEDPTITSGLNLLPERIPPAH